MPRVDSGSVGGRPTVSGAPGDGSFVASGERDRLTRIAADGGRVYVSSGAEPGFDVLSAAGDLAQSFRYRVTLRPVDEPVIDALRTEWRALYSSSDWAREVEQLITDMPMPDVVPAVDRMHVSATGDVWLRSFEVAATDRVWMEHIRPVRRGVPRDHNVAR